MIFAWQGQPLVPCCSQLGASAGRHVAMSKRGPRGVCPSSATGVCVLWLPGHAAVLTVFTLGQLCDTSRGGLTCLLGPPDANVNR